MDGELGAVGEIDPACSRRTASPSGWRGSRSSSTACFARAQPDRRYRRVSRYPSSDIDLAFVLAEAVPAGDVEATLRGAGGELLAELRLFDVYRGAGGGEGRRSLAYRSPAGPRPHAHRRRRGRGPRAVCIAAVEEALGATFRA